MDEAQILDGFKSDPSRESLHALLLAHQGRVYNACFQVLGRAEDAEDAAQDALLKLAEGARSAQDADSFRGWIYRVSLHAALDLWRRREAIRARESRAAMNRPAAPPLDDRERVALFEAMDGLDDTERSLLLEHYFEKIPLPQLGDRRGVSAVAIWKRIDKAREKLKKLLLAGGFVAASAGVADSLEGSVPIAAPPSLLAEAALSKMLAGGFAMGMSKGVVAAAAAVALLLGFGLGAGTVSVIKARERRIETPVTRAEIQKSTVEAPPQVAQAPAPPESAPPDPAPARNKLRDRLDEYKAWFLAWRASVAASPKPRTSEESIQRTKEADRESRRRLAGVRELIFEDPDTFLAFIADPDNERMNDWLIGHSLHVTDDLNGAVILKGQSFSSLPPALMDGLLKLLASGKSGIQAPILNFLGQVHEPSDQAIAVYRGLMRDPNPAVQGTAIQTLGRLRKLEGESLDEVKALVDTSPDANVRRKAIDAVASALGSDSEKWLLEKLESNQDASLTGDLASGLMMKLYGGGPFADSRSVDRYVRAFSAAVAIRTNEPGFYNLVACITLLPTDRSQPLLEAALPQAPNEKLSEAVRKVLEKIKAGEESPKALLSQFSSAIYPQK